MWVRLSPPTHTVKPVDPPPPSDHPTPPMLKADIDSGRTGDKVGVFDPGLSTLGTDDEAAGRPPSPFRIALARYQETFGRWAKGGRGSVRARASKYNLCSRTDDDVRSRGFQDGQHRHG